MRVSFVGLGVMGYPMAGYLANNNHDVVVYNRTASKADAWCAEYHGAAAATPAAAAHLADIVFVCVGNDDDLRQVVLGDEGILAGKRSGRKPAEHTGVVTKSSDHQYSCAWRLVRVHTFPFSGGGNVRPEAKPFSRSRGN